MDFDNLIECSRCGSDAAYIQEINPQLKIEMCLGCGFQSNSLMRQGSEFLEEQMGILPELYKALLDEEEETGKIWMPSTTRVEGKGMIFADGSSRDNWAWAAARDVEVKEDEKEKYKGAKYRTDMTTVKHFKEKDYIDALSYIGILPE